MNMQSKSQLVETWGQHVAEGWIDSVGIKLLGKNDGEGAKWASELIGSVTYSYPTYSSDSNARRSTNWSSGQEEPIFTPNQIKTALGQGKFIVHGINGVELNVQFPNTLDELPLLRKPDVPSLLCFAPHKLKIAQQTKTAPPAVRPEAMASGTVAIEDIKAIGQQGIEAKQQESETVITQQEFDLAEITKESFKSMTDEIENKLSEKTLTTAVEAIAGADIAHVVEIALEVNEVFATLTQDTTQVKLQLLTKADRLKLRKKHKLETELEQSL